MSDTTNKTTRGDVVYALTKAGLSALPLVGGPAAELFAAVVQPPIERRRSRWMDLVGERLLELEKRGLDLNSLSANDEFISAVLQATSAAIKTHHREKLEALRNAVANIAIGVSPDETIAAILIRLIDELTPMHLKVLTAAHASPPSKLETRSKESGFDRFARTAGIPELIGKELLLKQLWSDLRIAGLIGIDIDERRAPPQSWEVSCTTFLGSALIKFITLAPPPGDRNDL